VALCEIGTWSRYFSLNTPPHQPGSFATRFENANKGTCQSVQIDRRNIFTKRVQ
jgi:hypothetical protein